MPIVTGYTMDEMCEEVRVFRQRKKNLEPTCCPVCSVTLRGSEMANHLSVELDRLNKLTGSPRSRKCNSGGCVSPVASTNGVKDTPSTSSNGQSTAAPDASSCWKTYMNIRNNRKARMKIPRKRRADDPECPICNDRIPYDIDIHVEACLKNDDRNNAALASACDPDDDPIDIEGDVHTTEIQGSCSSLTSTLDTQLKHASTPLDEDDELNVDGDDTQVYGPTQYSECNIIVSSSGDNFKEETENMYLRNLIIGQQNSSGGLHEDDEDDDDGGCNINGEAHADCPEEESNDVVFVGSRDQTIESLKAKIREYETRINKNDSLKCLICMDEFRQPVVSICCWHVHCEVCWLRTLGARKLCPQCNMITSPSDLRRVYM